MKQARTDFPGRTPLSLLVVFLAVAGSAAGGAWLGGALPSTARLVGGWAVVCGLVGGVGWAFRLRPRQPADPAAYRRQAELDRLAAGVRDAVVAQAGRRQQATEAEPVNLPPR